MAEKVIFSGSTHEIWIKTGVTDIDVGIDIYSAWKEWVMDNPKWDAAFRTFGGDPTTTSQFAPKYYFLINNWRVMAKNVSVSIQTNLYSEDYDSPFIVENAAVTNRTSDVPVIKSELEQRLDYGDRIYYDETSPYSGTIYPVGTIAQPINNITDAIGLGELYNIRDFYCLSNVTFQNLTGETFISYSLFADRENLTAKITGNTMINTDWHGFIIDINFGGGYGNLLNKCIINRALDISGKLTSCQIGSSIYRGEIKVEDNLVIASCYSGVAGAGTPLYDMHYGKKTLLSIRGYSGGVEIVNCDTTDSKSTVELIAGQIRVHSSCTDGYLDLRGVGYITNNAGTGCTVETKGFVDSFELFIEESREIDEKLAYSGTIYYDSNNGFTGTTYPIGTIAKPVNNIFDLFTISQTLNIKYILSKSDFIVSGFTGLAKQYTVESDQAGNNFNMYNGNNVEKLTIIGFNINGDFKGINHIFKNCTISNVVGLAGELEQADINGKLGIENNTTFILSHPDIAGGEGNIYMTNSSGTSVAFRNYSGSINFENVKHINDKISIDLNAGHITFSSGCTNGIADLRGVGYITDNSLSGFTTILDGFIQATPGEYDNIIIFDEMLGNQGQNYPIGTEAYPVNNITDALILLEKYSLNKIKIIDTLTINNGEDLSGIAFTAERSTGNYLNITNAITDGTYIENLTCNIVQSGTCRYTTSVLINIDNFDGGAKDCLIIDNNIKIVGSGANYFTNCDRYITDNSKTVFDIGDKKLNLIRCRGSYEISNKTSTNVTTIHLVAGGMTVNSSCTSGVIGIGGICEVTDNSSSGCTVYNKALSNPSIADATWDEQLSEHLLLGSTGDALNNVSAGASPELIAQAVWNTQLSGFTTPGSAGYSLQFLFDVASGTTSGITQEISDDVKRILGLTQENFLIKDHVYDAEDLLQSATIRTFTNAGDTTSDSNPLAEYYMTALYDGSGRLTNYKVIKV